VQSFKKSVKNLQYNTINKNIYLHEQYCGCLRQATFLGLGPAHCVWFSFWFLSRTESLNTTFLALLWLAVAAEVVCNNCAPPKSGQSPVWSMSTSPDRGCSELTDLSGPCAPRPVRSGSVHLGPAPIYPR